MWQEQVRSGPEGEVDIRSSVGCQEENDGIRLQLRQEQRCKLVALHALSLSRAARKTFTSSTGIIAFHNLHTRSALSGLSSISAGSVTSELALIEYLGRVARVRVRLLYLP